MCILLPPDHCCHSRSFVLQTALFILGSLLTIFPATSTICLCRPHAAFPTRTRHPRLTCRRSKLQQRMEPRTSPAPFGRRARASPSDWLSAQPRLSCPQGTRTSRQTSTGRSFRLYQAGEGVRGGSFRCLLLWRLVSRQRSEQTNLPREKIARCAVVVYVLRTTERKKVSTACWLTQLTAAMSTDTASLSSGRTTRVLVAGSRRVSLARLRTPPPHSRLINAYHNKPQRQRS